MRTQCPTCDQFFDGRRCPCGYLIQKVMSSDAPPIPEIPTLSRDEQRAYFVELKATLARLGHGPTRTPTPPRTIQDADTGPSLSPTHTKIIHPCGCVYSESRLLLAMCRACHATEETTLTAHAKYATLPLSTTGT